jgi:thiamine pyrophosphokinase
MADVVIIVTGSAPLAPAAVSALPPDAVVVAADGGLDHALAAGLQPSVLVGDLDSVTAAGLEWAAAHATIERHPADKGATDTELALRCAAALHPRRIVLVSGHGDRLDHTIATLGALGDDALGGVAVVDGWLGTDAVSIAVPSRPVAIDRPEGTTFSVLALRGPCRGVTLRGARWPLTDAVLPPVSGLGVSNQVAESPCHLDVAAGVATVIIPGAQP